MSPMRSRAASAAAGEAGDDDVEQRDNAVDDGHEDGADGIHDGHQARADGLADGFDARDDGTHVCGLGCLFLLLLCFV